MVVETAYAAATAARFLDDHKEDLEPGAAVGVLLLPEGETAKDPLEFDPERAAAEYEAQQARHGRPDMT